LKLVDTTVVVDYLRGRPQAVELLASWGSSERIVASELVRFELLAGARAQELPELNRFLATLEWIPVTRRITEVGGELARRYRPSHGGIEDVDYLIAGTAIVLGIGLSTTNVKHFPMLEGLQPAY